MIVYMVPWLLADGTSILRCLVPCVSHCQHWTSGCALSAPRCLDSSVLNQSACPLPVCWYALDCVGDVSVLVMMQGLIHISELSWSRVTNIESIVQPGSEVQCKLIEIDVQQGRIKLSLKVRQDQEHRLLISTGANHRCSVGNTAIIEVLIVVSTALHQR